MPTPHSLITVGACADPLYIPRRLDELIAAAQHHPLNAGRASGGGLLPHRIINQGPVFWLSDAEMRASILSLNDAVLGGTAAFLIDLHSACAGVIAHSDLTKEDDQREYQTRQALAHGQAFTDALAKLAGHPVEVAITYTDFEPGGLSYRVYDIATFQATSAGGQ